MTEHRTRVIQSIGDPGKWQAQYFDPSLEVWCDIGDATYTHEEAKTKQEHYRSLEEVRRIMDGLEMQTLDDGSLFLVQDNEHPDRLKLSITDGKNWPADDGTTIRLDIIDLLRIMKWGNEFLIRRHSGE